MAIAPGTRLGPYEVLAPLRAGGMGEIYRARDTRLGRIVAIKVLPARFSSDEVLKRRFELEARAISSINHPHICTLLDIGSQNGITFLVLEFLEGMSLGDTLQGGPLPMSEAIDIAIDIADGLDKAHREGIIHRDLKPGNVMLCESGAKLLDFGLAKAEHFLADPALEAPTLDDHITQAGMVLGTVGYFSPEQARGLAVDARTDIWSLGVVLYQMVTGRLPFPGETQTDVISAILREEPPPLAPVLEGIPERLDEIIRKALAKKRDERYQTVRDMLIDLRRLKRKLEGRPSGSLEIVSGAGHGGSSAAAMPMRAPSSSAAGLAPGTPPPPPGRLYRRLLLPLILLAVLAVGAIILVPRLGAHSDSLAVLPFTYANSDPRAMSDPDRDYLSDGLTETVINSVAQLPNVKVISSTSVFRYKGKQVDPATVGHDLDVEKVLMGRITQRGDELTISVELVDARDRHHIWGEQYDKKMEDLVALPRQVAREISDNLRTRWASGVVKTYTNNPAAYQAYLKGLYCWNKRTEADLRQAITYFQEAVNRDPQYALAYAGLSDTYHVLWVYANVPPTQFYLPAKQAAERSIQIDDNLAEGHTALAAILADDEWDFPAAEREYRRAIELNPNYATAHQWFGEYLTYVGNFDEAISELHRAQRLDPLSLVINSVLGQVYTRAGRYDDAIAQLKKTLELDRNFGPAHSNLRDAYLAKKMFDEAMAEGETVEVLGGYTPEHAAADHAALRAAYSQQGESGYWRMRIQQALADMKQGNVIEYDETPYHIAAMYAHLGDTDAAFQWLQKAFEQREINVVYLKTDPAFAQLLSDARAQELMRRIHN